MPTGAELENRVRELLDSGMDEGQAAEAIYREDINTPYEELVSLLFESPSRADKFVVTRAKGRVAVEARGRPSPSKGTPQVSPQPEKPQPKKPVAPESGEPAIVAGFRDAVNVHVTTGDLSFRQSLVRLYARKHNQLNTPESLKGWLAQMGCTPTQCARVSEELSMDMVQAQGWQQPQYQTVLHPQTGQPMVVMVTPQQQPSPQQQPWGQQPQMPSYYPPYYPPYQSGSDPRIEMLEKGQERLEKALVELSDAMKRPAESKPLMRRVPMVNADGSPMKDGDHVIYQEMPYDPAMNTLEMITGVLRATGTIGGNQKTLDADAIRNIARDEADRHASADAQELRTREAIQAAISQVSAELNPRLESVSQELGALKTQKEIQEAVQTATAPLLETLNALKNRSGLSDQQAAFAHREEMTRQMQSFLSGIVDSVRGDIKPAVLQGLVAGMKAQGISDDIIQAVITQANVHPAGAASTGRIADKVREMRAKWMAEGS